MANAPVYFTVAQVRFNPILNLEGFLPAIQERMRKARFPDFKRETVQKIVYSFGAAEAAPVPTPSLVPHARCFFGDIDNVYGFLLENNSLTLHTTKYEKFESFSDTFLSGLNIIDDVIRLDFIERVGLRYLNAVLPAPNELLSAYLIPEVIGLSNAFTEQMRHAMSETVMVNTEGDHLVARVVILNGRVGLPADLMGFSQKIAAKFTQSEGRHAIIDIDAFREQREPFDKTNLSRKLHNLHDNLVRKSFEKIATNHAMTVWLGR